MIYKGDFKDCNMITWTINDQCNFNCSYCTLGSKRKQNLDPINIQKLSTALSQLPNDWLILVTGGEPFLEKNILDICQEITKRHYLSLITNLSTPNIIHFFDNIDPKRTLFISTSIHINEREKRDKNLSSYIQKVLYLKNKGFNVIASYVTHPELFDRMVNDFSVLKTNGIQAHIKIFKGVYNGKYYPSAFNHQERSFLENFEYKYPEFEILNKQQQFHGLLCRAGQRFFTMDRYGNLRRCSAVLKTYGNFFKKKIYFDTKPRPCPLKHCGCPYEGIRNVLDIKGNFLSRFQEDLIEISLKFRKVINNPKKLMKVKEMGIMYLSQWQKKSVS